MVIITEVQFAHADGALAGTLGERPDLHVTVIRETSTDPERNVYHLRFADCEVAEVRPLLEDDHTVRDVEPGSELADGCLCRVEFAPETKLLGPRVTSEGGFVVDARSPGTKRHPEGWYERWVLPDRRSLQRVWRYAREKGFEFEVVELHSLDHLGEGYRGTDTLTARQREALVVAYEEGYFAEPRETSLEELAGLLDLSPSAVGGRLRRGLRALVGGTLVTNPPEE